MYQYAKFLLASAFILVSCASCTPDNEDIAAPVDVELPMDTYGPVPKKRHPGLGRL